MANMQIQAIRPSQSSGPIGAYPRQSIIATQEPQSTVGLQIIILLGRTNVWPIAKNWSDI
jgi:hypothetical protein